MAGHRPRVALLPRRKTDDDDYDLLTLRLQEASPTGGVTWPEERATVWVGVQAWNWSGLQGGGLAV